MKTTTNSILALILSGIWACWATAGEQPKAVGRHVEPDIPKWDADKNGRLDGDEMDAMQREKIRERQDQQEARRNAAVEARKLDEAARRTRMVPPSQLKEYDKNGNGLIDLDEWTIYRKDMKQLIAEKRAARLAAANAATNAAPASVDSTSPPSKP